MAFTRPRSAHVLLAVVGFSFGYSLRLLGPLVAFGRSYTSVDGLDPAPHLPRDEARARILARRAPPAQAPAAGAIAPASPEPAPSARGVTVGSVHADPELQALWDRVYRPLGASEQFAKMFGDLPVRPLGMGASAYAAWKRANSSRTLPAEPLGNIYRRLSIVNYNTLNPLREGNFQTFAYRSGDSLETIVGVNMGMIQSMPDFTVQYWALRAEKDVSELKEETRAELLRLVETWEVKHEEYVREWWRACRESVLAKCQTASYEPDVQVAYTKGDGVLNLIRRGQDSLLDRLVFERDELESDCLQAVRRALCR